MSVFKKLMQARIKLHSMDLKKSGHNKFAGYHYFELGDFLLPSLTIFNELGLFGAVSFTSDLATLRIYDVEAPEQFIDFTSPMGSAALKGCHEVQNIGAVETYQRRYLWVAAMEIVEHDALDALGGKDDVAPKVKPAAGKPASQAAAKTDGPEPDAEILAQLNAATDIAGLTAVMNTLPQAGKKLYVGHFNQRMTELRKAA
jgi:hypothetical protein